MPIILPEVTKAIEHSHPDVRKAAERAKEKLLHGAKMEEGAAPPPVDDDALAAHMRAGLATLPEIVAHYVAEVTAELLEDKEVTTAAVRCICASLNPAAHFPPAQELAGIVAPIVSSFVDAAAVDSLCESVVALHEERVLAAMGKDIHAGKTLIVNIANIILAFAGKVLLNKTPFYLEKGHCYGLVGQNGVGASPSSPSSPRASLTPAPARQDDAADAHRRGRHQQLPEGRLHLLHPARDPGGGWHVGHHLHARRGAGGLLHGAHHRGAHGGWLHRRARGGRGERALGGLAHEARHRAQHALERGPAAARRAHKVRAVVSVITGCYSLRPRSHLDTGAVEWLASYIRSLKCTVCLVSHDYDFLELVLTDVVHICDGKLTYYPGTFKSFQKTRPEIVAGLPSPAGAVARAMSAINGAPAAAPLPPLPAAEGEEQVRHTLISCGPFRPDAPLCSLRRPSLLMSRR